MIVNDKLVDIGIADEFIGSATHYKFHGLSD